MHNETNAHRPKNERTKKKIVQTQMENNETGPKLTNKTCTFLLNNVGKCILFEEQICMSANSDKTPTKRVSKNKTKIEGINPLLKWLPFFEMLRGKKHPNVCI